MPRLAIVARAIGANPQFGIGVDISPELWIDPAIAHELNATKIRPNVVGNKMGLLVRREHWRRRLRKSPDDPMRAAMLEADFGLAPVSTRN